MKPPANNATTGNPDALIRTPAWYARVSTGRQENEATIDSQIDEVEQRISADGLALATNARFKDDGWTGTVLERPGLDAMLDAAKAGEFNVLYTYDLGRLARKYHYQRIIIEELEACDVEVISLHDRKIESDEDQILQGIEGIFYEYERLKIARRFQRGKMYKAKNGVLVSGQVPYGYNRFKKTDEAPAHVTVNDEEAAVVRQIFDWFGNNDLSINDIRRQLHEDGIKPRKAKSDYWTKGPIIRLLQATTYIDGVIHYNKSEAVIPKNPIKNEKYKKVKKSSRQMRPKEEWLPYPVPAILSDRDLFDRVQKRLQDNKRQRVAHPKYNYLLTGLIWCECGMRRVGSGSSRHGHCYYRCAERIYNFNGERTCFSAGVNAAAMDFVLWDELTSLINNPERLEQHANVNLLQQLQQENEPNARIAQLEDLIAKIEVEVERYNKAYGAGVMELDQLKNVTNDAQRRRSTYQKQINKLEEAREDLLHFPQLNVLCKEASRVIDELDTNDKKGVIRDVIDKVIVRADNQVEVCGHIPLNRPHKGLASRHEDRDSQHTIPLFETTFWFVAPEPRIARRITERDRLGRIVRAGPGSRV